MDNQLWMEIGKFFTSVTAITTGVVWLGKYIFDNSAKTLLEKYKNELKINFEREKIEIQKEKESFDRKFEEIKKWTNPILSSVNGIIGRLDHIINQNGYKELQLEHIGYDYYFSSTLYYFSQYLCWIQILKKEINYEIFDENEKETSFFKAIKDVNIAIREYDTNIDFSNRGNPIYSLQQREIAEILRIENSNNCMGYCEFNKKISNNVEFKQILSPIKNLFENLQKSSKDFERLKNIYSALKVLKIEAENILKVKAS